MLYGLIDGELRQPRAPGERAACRACAGPLLALLPGDGPPQWRHVAGDCDAWDEPELAWHAAWKERFPAALREIPLEDPATSERHRADLCAPGTGGRRTVVELQHAPLPEAEIWRREDFYLRQGRLYWLLHVHDEGQGALRTCMQVSIAAGGRSARSQGADFTVLRLPGRSVQFIEQWKRSSAYVLLDIGGQLHHFATRRRSEDLLRELQRGEFALRPLKTESFLAVVAPPAPAPP
ncbi:hypothetical protein [Caldimonas tepidiphila]|uniref:hypothetical protein n=1 Tax=Caldimonas tepidiphila TaxID=2315841 RepID=UPI000E5C4AA8|nr:hypothetical protein [Caldimonas tepidiphila]